MAPDAGFAFERSGSLGIIRLNRPRALNALTHEMVIAIGRQLASWGGDPQIGAVVIKAAPGRAFCAGGDVRAVNESFAREGIEVARRFFWDEYRMNWRIRHFPKPFIALIDGITMGGGVGLSAHGSHRVITENATLAMPETAIGMFPDVGGTYLLTRLPKAPWSVGMYLGLTGARLGPGDCLETGFGTHFAPAARLDELQGRLARHAPAALAGRDEQGRFELVEGELGAFDRWDEPQGPLAAYRERIERCFGAPSPVDLVRALESEPSGWGGEQLAILRGFSPFAVCLTHAQLTRGRSLDFDESLRVEYRLVQRVLEHGDFREGVRALLVDKDRQPRWRHRAIEHVPVEEIDACFAPLPDPEDELKFDWHR